MVLRVTCARELLEASSKLVRPLPFIGSLGAAAVAMVSGPGLVQGVVRFLQLSPQSCLIDGAIDGLEPGLHGLHVHEFGDVTNSCDR